ncbi:MAG: hypothetical protein DWI58_21805 [Chloroflexi bacterium]|nr:MAG: hypothetical protein DWI58_21805 [Chloroflexota bacterium]
MLTTATIREAPKALLHDHLDGGLRPATVIDLAREYGYRDLPTEDVWELAAWFRRGADRKSLELYLETFTQTVGVMQDYDARTSGRARRRSSSRPSSPPRAAAPSRSGTRRSRWARSTPGHPLPP